jgi:Lrp/AsnC family transcriptional regulator, leucine-responsive regulatory protein
VQSIKTDIPMQMVKQFWELPLAPDGRFQVLGPED